MTAKFRITAKGNVELKMDRQTAEDLKAILNKSGHLRADGRITTSQEDSSELLWKAMSPLGNSEYPGLE